MANDLSPGAFCWNELSTNEPAKAAAFYKGLFGWESKTVDMGGGATYTLLKNGETEVGGLQALPEEAGTSTPHWSSYVYVDNVDDSCEKAAGLGGEVVQPPVDIPNIGRFAFVKDPTGASIALWENKKS